MQQEPRSDSGSGQKAEGQAGAGPGAAETAQDAARSHAHLPLRVCFQPKRPTLKSLQALETPNWL